MEIEYAKLGCEYAIEIGELKAASVIAGNFMQIYHGIERNAKKALEIGRVRIDVNKKIIDAGLDHDLKRYIEDAQNYSDVYRMELGLKNKETAKKTVESVKAIIVAIQVTLKKQLKEFISMIKWK